MTNGPGKSDRPVVPEKSLNKAGQPAVEGMEGSGWPKGTCHSKTRPGHRAGKTRPVR
jgi:RNA-directed DNA polymerase